MIFTMRISLIFSFIALTVIGTVFADDDDCDLEKIESCVTELLRQFLSQFKNFATDSEELAERCGEFKKTAKCATSQPKYCKDRYPMLKNVLKAIEKYSDRFCKNSKEQKLYLEQAPCLNQQKESFEICLDPKMNRHQIDHGCKNLKDLISCLNDTGNKCGKPAEKLMKHLMEPFDAYPITRTHQLGAWLKVFDCISWERGQFDDSTVECAFKNIRKCYKAIGKLGADLTVELPKTEQELRKICSGKISEDFSDCMKDVVWTCNSDIGNAINIRTDIGHICTDGSIFQQAFMNSTECYNSYVTTTKDCYNRYATKKSSDAKDLCYSVYKIKKCTNFLTNQCSKNVTINSSLRPTVLPAANLAHNYYGYADAVCEDYYRHFDSSALAILPYTVYMSMTLSLIVLTLLKITDYKLL